MYQPQTYTITLSFMIASMLCWGSWANAVKFTPGYRFQLFYWDYVMGLDDSLLFHFEGDILRYSTPLNFENDRVSGLKAC